MKGMESAILGFIGILLFRASGEGDCKGGGLRGSVRVCSEKMARASSCDVTYWITLHMANSNRN